MMSEKRPIRVFIADDFDILRQVMHLLLERAGDIDVIGEAPRLPEALEDVKALEPDVIIMNDYLPPIDSAHATERFRASGVSAPVLIVSMDVDVELIKRSFDAGANGFMHKDEMGDRLLDAVRHVHGGERYLSPKAEEALRNPEN